MYPGTCSDCYHAHELEEMVQEPNPPQSFASLVTSPCPTNFALILTCIQSITMCCRDVQCSRKTKFTWNKAWCLGSCGFPNFPVRP